MWFEQAITSKYICIKYNIRLECLYFKFTTFTKKKKYKIVTSSLPKMDSIIPEEVKSSNFTQASTIES